MFEKPAILPFDPSVQLHLLRHFVKPDDAYLKKLSGELGITLEEVCNELNVPASRFYPVFASDPSELYTRLSKTKAEQWCLIQSNAGKEEYRIVFDEKHWLPGIGEDSVVPVHEIIESRIQCL